MLDTLYVRLSAMIDDWPQCCTNGRLIEGLRGRNYADDERKQFSYWELCKTSQGIFIVYQTRKKSTWLAHAISNLSTFFKNVGFDPSLAKGLQYLDFKGVLLLDLPLESIGETGIREEEEEVPARFRPEEKLTWEECRQAIVDAGGVPKESHKAWAEATNVCEVDTLTEQTKRICLRDGPQPLVPTQHMTLIRSCVPAVGPPLSAAEVAKAQRTQDKFDLEYAMTVGLCEDTRERLGVEVAGMEPSVALEHVMERRNEMKVAGEKDESNRFGYVRAEPLFHGAHHTFDGVLHIHKAKTSKTQGEAEWNAILKARLENDFHGFQHAVKTAHDLMNAGFLPDVSRVLNPKNKKSLMIHRVRTVCDDLIRGVMCGVDADDDFNVPDRNHLMTDAEFEKEVYGLKSVLGGESEYACSVCGGMSHSALFFVPATMMWHPIGIKGFGSVTAFDCKQLGKSQFIVCGSTCDDLLKQKPKCPSCGIVEEIKWSDETYVDPAHLQSIPSMRKLLEAFHKFYNVSAEIRERRGRMGLTLEETNELKEIEESNHVQEFHAHMEKPVPLVRSALCKQCGKHVFPVKERSDDSGAWKYA